MKKHVLRVSLVGLTLASACADPADPSSPSTERITAGGARVVRAEGAPLTPPSMAPPAAVAAAFIRDRAATADVELGVAAEVAGRGGVTHVRLEQTVGGLRVHGAYAKVAISDRGEVLQLIDQLVPVGTVTPATVGAAQAIAAARANLGYDAAAVFHRAPSAEKVAYASASGLREGYVVETWSERHNLLDYTLVDGAGAIVSVERRTNTDSYNVFVEDPGKGPQTTVAGPGAGNAESPTGWLSGAQRTFAITGNNTRTYLDTDSNNAADTGGTTVTTGNFLTAVNLTQSPSTTSNKEVAVQNLFYLTNRAHDILYRHGFNEANGNFQTNNFGLGGLGNDPVNAEAQDGGGLDNANFATPTDGSAPRMQMYLWSGTTPNGLITVNGVDYGLYGSSFGAALTATGVTGALANYVDATAPAGDGCQVATVSLTGKIAVVDRGTCNFTDKVLNAQKAGAIGVVIANNVAGNPFGPGGTNSKIRVPSGMVSLADGTTLHGLAGVSGRLHTNPTPPLRIDGDLDADIVFHEYGHGLTWRMIGSMSGKLAGAIGEGASDVNAFLIDGDDIMGEYAYSDPRGIRRYPYIGYPLTYSSVDGGEVHNDGEIYAGAMWRVLENYLGAGLTADDLQGDWVDGMNFTPAGPAFEDMRDGMLQAVAGTGRECLIWRGFAASGIGVGADGRLQGPNVIITESFALPPGC